MCLAIPGRILRRWDEGGALLAEVDFAGELRRVKLNFLPDLEVGDHVIVHAGFAITRLDEASANETLQMFADLGILEEELGGLESA